MSLAFLGTYKMTTRLSPRLRCALLVPALLTACASTQDTLSVDGDPSLIGEYQVAGFGVSVRTSSGCGDDRTTWEVVAIGVQPGNEYPKLYVAVELEDQAVLLHRAAGDYDMGETGLATVAFMRDSAGPVIFADAGLLTLLDPVDIDVPPDADQLMDLVERGQLRLELASTAGTITVKGRLELERDRSLDGSAHQFCD